MKREEFEILAIDYLRDALTEEESLGFEELLENDKGFASQFNQFQETWSLLETMKVPEPSTAMDEKFFRALGQEIDSQKKIGFSFKKLLDNLMIWVIKPQFAYGLLALVLIGGYFINRNNESNQGQVESLVDSDAHEVRERLVLTLLEQGSANQRLQGVSEASKITEVDEQVINALLKTLNKDSNVNVRLAAIESLTNYVDDPTVRQGLIQSIPNQESPIIQVTLANLMLALEEKKSIEPFRQLLKKPELDTTVKKKIEKTIKSII